jgi:predicted flavoprotein YhiN
MGALSQKEIVRLASLLKEFVLEADAYPGFDAAQATMGGVDTREIHAQTMMSKLVEGLYFAGEIIDIDGRCGGYNLQWAWSSGYVAGCHSAIGEVKCYESTNVK